VRPLAPLDRLLARPRYAAFVASALAVAACSAAPAGGGAASDETPVSDGPAREGAAPGGGSPGETGPDDPGGATPPGCAIPVTSVETALATATTAGEQVLTIDAQSTSKTSWAEEGNEAVVLEVLHAGQRVGHLVLHQGQDPFTYSMHAGALQAGDALTVRVSPLTAPRAAKSACITKVTLAPPAPELAEGVAHAPIVKWPTEKSFDDLPILLGWSKAGKSYQLAYTNENGGTVALCGGGARGVRSEIARWGRGLDIEGVWAYGGAGRFERCTGVVPPAPNAPRMQDQHPVLYYGDGHNRVFESRGGYGDECGTGSDKTPDGALQGWNTNDPGDGLADDDPYTIVLRPVPVDMDALGVRTYAGRREGIVDTYAPWLYRLVDSELAREGKIDGSMTLPMSRYLFVDVYAKDVGGSGDGTCGPVPITPQITHVTGGFKLRAVAKDGTVSDGPQMTVDYFNGGGSGVKRVAVPLAPGVTAADVTKLTFDAYDDDGIYFLGIGDAFVPVPQKTNGARLDYVNVGMKSANVYVDDGSSGCVAGKSLRDGVEYPCVGSAYTLAL
jgi:hypothetical protein